MPLQERSKVHRCRSCDQEGDNRLPGRIKTNRQLVREVSNRNVWGFAEYQLRQIAPLKTNTEDVREVRKLLAFGREPPHVGARQHRVEQHDAFDRCSDRRCLAVSIVRFSDGVIKGAAVNVKDLHRAIGVGCRRGMSPCDEGREEVLRFLTSRDAGKLAVLPHGAHTGMKHYQHQEACLSFRVASRDDGIDAVLLRHRSISSASRS
jgi:hypothetical protein